MKPLRVILIAACVALIACVNSRGQSPDTSKTTPAAAPNRRPQIGLVLEGGGALGLAHIGVLQWFEENRIPIDSIAGTSMGSLIGGLYASGHSTQQLRDVATKSVLPEIFTISEAYSDIGYRRREDRRDLPQAITFNLHGGVGLRDAVLTDVGLNEFLRKELSAYNSENLSFNELPIPFRCVATDLNTLEPVVFADGPLPQAIRASISIPGVFSPVLYHGHYLVDGAALDNLPTDVSRRDLHADVVIAVHLNAAPMVDNDVNSILGVLTRAYAAGTSRSEKSGMKLADIVIQTQTQKFTTSDYAKGAALIQAGHEAAEAQRSALLQYQLSESDWQQYLSARASRRHSAPGILHQIKIEGGTKAAQEVAAHDLQPEQGKPINEERITKDLHGVQGSGTYVASFETYSNQVPSAPQSSESVPDTGVLVKLSKQQGSGPELLFGLDMTAVTHNVTRTSFDFRLINRDLGGYNSELRTDVRVGFLTQIGMEYHRELTPSGWFVQPKGGILRQPVYLWADQQRVAEFSEQQAGGGAEFGKIVRRNIKVDAEWSEQNVRWEQVSGTNNEPNVIGNAQTGLLHFNYDRALTGAVSPSSLRVDVEAGSLFHAVGSSNAPLLNIRTSQTWTFHERNFIGLGTEVHSYFRTNVAEPFRFTTGGPLRLSASSVDEYRSTDNYLVRAGYMRRLAVLPSGLGQGVYAAMVYEAGEMWSPEKPAYLRQDGLSAIVVATPLGVVTVGGSIGDAGRKKLLFTLGKLF